MTPCFPMKWNLSPARARKATMAKLSRTFTIKNYNGPAITLTVSDDGYTIDGKRLTPDNVWLFDAAAIRARYSACFLAVLEAWVLGHSYRTRRPSLVFDDCGTVIAWIKKHWTM